MFNLLIKATEGGTFDIVRSHRVTRNAYAAYQEIIQTYTKKEKSKAEYHHQQYNNIPSLGPHDDPMEHFAMRKKLNLRVGECDATQMLPNSTLMMNTTSSFPYPDKTKPGTVDFAIAMKYQEFKSDVIRKGYDNYTLAEFQSELKDFYEMHIQPLQTKSKATPLKLSEEGDMKPKAQEAFAMAGTRRGGRGNQSRKFKARFNGNCNYCHIPGHKEADCNKKRRDMGNSGNGGNGNNGHNDNGGCGNGSNSGRGNGNQGG